MLERWRSWGRQWQRQADNQWQIYTICIYMHALELALYTYCIDHILFGLLRVKTSQNFDLMREPLNYNNPSYTICSSSHSFYFWLSSSSHSWMSIGLDLSPPVENPIQISKSKTFYLETKKNLIYTPKNLNYKHLTIG